MTAKTRTPDVIPRGETIPGVSDRSQDVMVCICRNGQGRRKVIVCSPAGEHAVRFMEIGTPKARDGSGGLVDLAALYGGKTVGRAVVSFGRSGPSQPAQTAAEALVVIDSTVRDQPEVEVEIGGRTAKARFIDPRIGKFRPCGLSRAQAGGVSQMVMLAEAAVKATEERQASSAGRELVAA